MSSKTLRQIPRFWRALACARPCANPVRHNHRFRNVPVRSVFDDFFGGRHRLHGFRPWPFRMMEDNLRTMERLVDSMAPWGRFRDPEMEFRPRREMQVKHNAKEYEVRMEIGDYQPEDLTVKLVGDQLSITGEIKHHDAHGSVSTQFSRQFTIPENVDVDTVESLFTSDGYLVVRAQVKGAENVRERKIHINREAPAEAEKPDSGAGDEKK